MKQKLQMYLLLAGGILAMSTASIFIRWAQADNAPSLVIAAYRLATATVVLSILAIHQRAWEDYAKLDSRAIAFMILSGGLLGLHFATWITSLVHTSVISSVVLVSTTPLWVGLAAPFLLGERTPWLTWLGIIVAIIGGGIIGLADWSGAQTPTIWGDLLAMMGAVFGAGYFMIGRGVRTKLRLVPYLWLVYGVAALLLIVWCAIDGLPLTGFSARTVCWMVALGLIPQLIGHSTANYVIRRTSATFVAVTILGEPAGSTVLAIFLLGELPGFSQVIGGTLVLTGITLASIAEEHFRGKSKPEATESQGNRSLERGEGLC